MVKASGPLFAVSFAKTCTAIVAGKISIIARQRAKTPFIVFIKLPPLSGF
jgi:hypothetical protein